MVEIRHRAGRCLCLKSFGASAAMCISNLSSSWGCSVGPKVLGDFAKRQLLNEQYVRVTLVHFLKPTRGRSNVSGLCAC